MANFDEKIEIRERCKVKNVTERLPIHRRSHDTKNTMKKKNKQEIQTTSAYSFVTFAIFFAAPFHRSSKWLAACCLLASRFLVFFLFGVVLARPFFPQFSPVDSKTLQRSAFHFLLSSYLSIFFFSTISFHRGIRFKCIV